MPDVSNLADTNFISATTSGNLAEAPAENASSSLIASKNRMMAEQVQHLNRNKDYMDEPYTEAEANSTIWPNEDGACLVSPMAVKSKRISKRMARSNQRNNKSDK